MNIVQRTVASLLIFFATAACAGNGKNGTEKPAAPALLPSTVRVSNNNWQDMTVYVLRAGTRTRLGTVTSLRTVRFRIPAALQRATGDIRLAVDPIGSRQGYVTPSIQFWPGQEIEFTIENQLSISSVSVWNR